MNCGHTITIIRLLTCLGLNLSTCLAREAARWLASILCLLAFTLLVVQIIIIVVYLWDWKD